MKSEVRFSSGTVTFQCCCFFFLRAPPVSLKPNARYEQVMMAFGGKGYFVRTPEELQQALNSSFLDKNVPSLINVMIDPQSDRKKQVISWNLSFLWSVYQPTTLGRIDLP